VLGFLVAVASTARVPAAASLVALFCLFHGYVHAETPDQFWQPAFTGGFVLSMLTLQVLGAAIAVLLSRRTMILRSAGACCAIAGLIGLLLTN
jgi:hydrogenase/urease accessory protein HupE